MRSLKNLFLRKCKQSLVKILHDIVDFEYLMEAEDSLAILFKQSLQRLLLNSNVVTCDEQCLREWEKIFGFNGNGTIENRREAVLSRIRNFQIINEKHIRDNINKIFGGIEHKFIIDKILLMMEVTTSDLSSAYIEILKKIESYLRPIIPQNIELLVINELISLGGFFSSIALVECDFLTIQAKLPTTMFTRLIDDMGSVIERGQISIQQRDMTSNSLDDVGGVMTIE